MILWLLRAIFILVCGLLLMAVLPTLATNPDRIPVYRAIGFEIGMGAALIIVGLEWALTHRKAALVPTLVLSLLLGSLVGPPTGRLLMMNETVRRLDAETGIVPSFFTLLFVFLFAMVIAQTRSAFRLSLPFVEFRKQERGRRPLLLDTSAIIDGRIADLCETRLVSGPVLVPRFVLDELQQVADSSDRLKRNRGRRGLDVLARMQKSASIELKMDETPVPDEAAVDGKLLALAKSLDAALATADFNLHKRANLQGVQTVLLNEVANALRPAVLPGEQVTLDIVRPGDGPGQGVGYLEDGTMIVVEEGRPHVGRTIPVTVMNALQTHGGRMLFARPVPGSAEPTPAPDRAASPRARGA